MDIDLFDAVLTSFSEQSCKQLLVVMAFEVKVGFQL